MGQAASYRTWIDDPFGWVRTEVRLTLHATCDALLGNMCLCMQKMQSTLLFPPANLTYFPSVKNLSYWLK